MMKTTQIIAAMALFTIAAGAKADGEWLCTSKETAVVDEHHEGELVRGHTSDSGESSYNFLVETATSKSSVLPQSPSPARHTSMRSSVSTRHRKLVTASCCDLRRVRSSPGGLVLPWPMAAHFE